MLGGRLFSASESSAHAVPVVFALGSTSGATAGGPAVFISAVSFFGRRHAFGQHEQPMQQHPQKRARRNHTSHTTTTAGHHVQTKT